MLKYSTIYTVLGHGRFPFDMLRYDNSLPLTSEDTSWMNLRSEERELALVSLHQEKSRKPTIARWASFGWTVTEIRKAQPAEPLDLNRLADTLAHPTKFDRFDYNTI